MIDTSNLTAPNGASVPASHGKVPAHRLSLRSKRRLAAKRKELEEGKNLAGGERHYNEPIMTMDPIEEGLRHEITSARLEQAGIEVTFNAKRGLYPQSQDLQNEASVQPKPKPKARTRYEKESNKHIRKATPLKEYPKVAGATGARVRSTHQSTEPLERGVPRLAKDDKRMPATKKSLADAAKFQKQMDEWREMKRIAAEMQD